MLHYVILSKKRIKQLISRVLFVIIICLVLGLLPISSDFSSSADTSNACFNLASGRGLPSRYLPISLVKLLTHRCTIACEINPSAVFWIKDLPLPHFCGPIRQLTLPGVSPAVCPWMHGLSSQDSNLSRAIIRLLYS